ncbi:hypothetical protein, partial [Paenibacillus gorillae]|uniref:hypothetical protein n=1 Tax=Paenibacillus gorillae TaxID=1243662 RepID=UPI0005AA8F5A
MKAQVYVVKIGGKWFSDVTIAVEADRLFWLGQQYDDRIKNSVTRFEGREDYGKYEGRYRNEALDLREEGHSAEVVLLWKEPLPLGDAWRCKQVWDDELERNEWRSSGALLKALAKSPVVQRIGWLGRLGAGEREGFRQGRKSLHRHGQKKGEERHGHSGDGEMKDVNRHDRVGKMKNAKGYSRDGEIELNRNSKERESDGLESKEISGEEAAVMKRLAACVEQAKRETHSDYPGAQQQGGGSLRARIERWTRAEAGRQSGVGVAAERADSGAEWGSWRPPRSGPPVLCKAVR